MEKKSYVKPLKRFHTSKLSPIRHAGFALLILRILESSLVDSRGARVRLSETEYQVKNGLRPVIPRILESSLVDSRGARVRLGETEYQVKNGLRPVILRILESSLVDSRRCSREA